MKNVKVGDKVRVLKHSGHKKEDFKDNSIEEGEICIVFYKGSHTEPLAYVNRTGANNKIEPYEVLYGYEYELFIDIPANTYYKMPSIKHVIHTEKWLVSVGYEMAQPMGRDPNYLFIHGSTKKFHYNNSESYIDDDYKEFEELYKYGMPIFIEQSVPEENPLITEAKKRYPVGTSFHPAHVANSSFYCTITENSVFKIISSDEITASINQQSWVDPDLSKNKIYGNCQLNRTVYYQGKWADIANVPRETEKKKEKVEIFPGIYIGDIVVSLTKNGNNRDIGNMFDVLPSSRNNVLYYKEDVNSSNIRDWRKATPEEINAYNLGARNIDKLIGIKTDKDEVMYCKDGDFNYTIPPSPCPEIELPKKEKHKEIEAISVFLPKKQQGMNMDVFTQQSPVVLSKPKPQLITI
jgi:hypothetical protein